MMGVHIPWMGTSFPILAPRTRTDSPSTAMCIFFGRAVSSALSFLFSSTSALYAGVPMGMTSVFAALNLALEAEHHISRICWRVAKLSVSRRYTVVSSANIAVTTRSIVLLTLYPARSEARSMVARDSMAMLNRRQDSGLPCRTPCDSEAAAQDTVYDDLGLGPHYRGPSRCLCIYLESCDPSLLPTGTDVTSCSRLFPGRGSQLPHSRAPPRCIQPLLGIGILGLLFFGPS